MKQLSDILYKVTLLGLHGSTAMEVTGICFDSRKVKQGCLFVAVSGSTADGHRFIDQAIASGARAVLCEHMPESLQQDITYVQVASSSLALAMAAENFYGNPSSGMQVVAVTGTNGKTTVATLLYHLFQGLHYRCGLLSTIENRINGAVVEATHTTPDAVQISELLSRMVKAGCTHCFMEASSHAVDQNRMAAIQLSGAIFTNLSHDHLDYHKTVANYIAAKKKLFDSLPASAFALVNADDRRGLVMLQNSRARRHTYSLQGLADFRARLLETSFDGMVLQVDDAEVYTPLVGKFNAYNLLAIYGAARLMGEDKITVLTVLSKLKPAEGRFDYVRSERERILGIVDYAHTPDALEKVLHTLKEIRTGNEKLFTIVGCGGNRDAAKRPVMARVASELSDRVILTSDNPRNEDPQVILGQMKEGIPPERASRVWSITDRREAIRTAVSMAGKGDILLVAGKGHEKYQEVSGVRYPFDDKEVLMESFRQMEK